MQSNPIFFPYSGITTQCITCHEEALLELNHCLKCISQRMLLVLDIDDTLIHPGDHSEQETIPPDFLFHDFNGAHPIFKRPGLDAFLKDVFDHYWVGFWSAGRDDYVQRVLQHILEPNQEPEFIFSRGQCIQDEKKKSLNHWLGYNNWV